MEPKHSGTCEDRVGLGLQQQMAHQFDTCVRSRRTLPVKGPMQALLGGASWQERSGRHIHGHSLSRVRNPAGRWRCRGRVSGHVGQACQSHAFNMACEQPTKYREGGRFVCKVFPNIDRLTRRRTSPANVDATDIEASQDGMADPKRLSPRITGISALAGKDSECPSLERLAEGGVGGAVPGRGFAPSMDRPSPTEPKEQLSEHPSTHRVRNDEAASGSAMTVAMMSAFACELTMKAIQLYPKRRDGRPEPRFVAVVLRLIPHRLQEANRAKTTRT